MKNIFNQYNSFKNEIGVRVQAIFNFYAQFIEKVQIQ